MIPDCELLNQYALEGSEEAFKELVRRHADLVYSVALRIVNGDRQLAQDVAQQIFLDLARQARQLSQRSTLAGWLHVSSRNAAMNLVRRERRRQVREQAVCVLEESSTTPEINWEHIRPVLDEAVASLKEIDRDAVVLRYFQGKSHREVGDALRLNEDAARVRVSRALDKLRDYFARRGIVASTVLLATAMSTSAVQAAPVSLAASIASNALAGAGASSSHWFFKSLSAAAQAKVAVAAAVLFTTLTVSVVYQEKEIRRLNAELTSTHQSLSANSARIFSFNDRLARLIQIAGTNGHSAVETTRAVDAVLNGVTIQEIPGLLEAIGKLPQTSAGSVVKVALLGLWAKGDPLVAMAWATAQVNDPNRGDYLISVLTAWSDKSMPDAWATATQLDNAAIRAKVEMSLLARLADRDPQTALDTLLKLPVGQRSKELYGAVFLSWAEKDPASASAAALKLPPSIARTTAITTVAASWAQQNQAAALAWAANLSSGAPRASALDEVMKTLAISDPAVATDYLGNLPNGSQRNQLVTDLASSWAIQDAPAALVWADSATSGYAHDLAMETILVQMSETDPAKVAAYLENVSQPYIRETVLPQVAKEWAQNDIQAALAWVQSLPSSDGAARSTAFQNVLDTWVQSDPTTAAAYLQGMTADPNLQAITTQVAKYWALTDPPAALAWIEGLSAGSIRDAAMESALTSYAAFDPAAAWDVAMALPKDGYGQTRLRFLSSIATVWSDSDPARVAHLLAALPSHSTQGVGAAMGVTAANWVKQDPAATMEWINSLPQDYGRDQAIAQVIAVEEETDFASAFQWARSIRQNAVKRPIIDDMVSAWAKKDPAAATAAIEADPTLVGTTRGTQLLEMVKRNAPNLPVNSDPLVSSTSP